MNALFAGVLPSKVNAQNANAPQACILPAMPSVLPQKEACSKALGTGFNHGVYLRDIAVINDANGKPSLRLTNGALARLMALIPAGKTPAIHVTLTDEPPLAQAIVIIEAV